MLFRSHAGALPEKFQYLAHMLGVEIGDVEKAEARRRTGKLHETGARGRLPIGACGVGKSKDRAHARHYHRDQGNLTSRVTQTLPAARL